MMSDDIEAMARAICTAKGINPDEKIFFTDSNHVRRLRWTDWIPHAEGAYEALRASGRLAPAVEGDVVEAGIVALEHSAFPRLTVRQIIELIAPIIAAATEARVREECAELAWVQAKQGATSDQIRNAIRTGATR